MLHNYQELEDIHKDLSQIEDENKKAMELSLEKRIRFKKKLAHATMNWPATKAEATVISENEEEREEYYKAYYTAPIKKEEMIAMRRKYYHAKKSAENNTMLDVEASRLWEQF